MISRELHYGITRSSRISVEGPLIPRSAHERNALLILLGAILDVFLGVFVARVCLERPGKEGPCILLCPDFPYKHVGSNTKKR